MRKLIVFLALAAVGGAAAAQQIYKYATPEGNVVYTDNPAAGLNGARKLQMPTMIAATTSSRLYEAQAGTPTPANPIPESFSAAQAEFRAAKQRRVEGVTPLPEERDGRYLKPGYWARQRELAQGLVLARTRVSQARAVAKAQATEKAAAEASVQAPAVALALAER